MIKSLVILALLGAAVATYSTWLSKADYKVRSGVDRIYVTPRPSRGHPSTEEELETGSYNAVSCGSNCHQVPELHAVPSPRSSQRIVGGSEVTIDRYPSMAAMLFGFGNFFIQWCGCTILNSRACLTAAHCYEIFGKITPERVEMEGGSLYEKWGFIRVFDWSLNPNYYRVRVGSTFANSQGNVHAASQLIQHPSYDWWTLDSDVAIIRLATNIAFNNLAQPAAIAGTNYNVADNQPVWATGWGRTQYGVLGSASEHLRHVQIYVINQAVCRARYAEIDGEVTDNMLCSGVLDVGGRDQCQGDSGGPLYHNNVVVGVCSWSEECALPRYPGVNVRVSRFTTWITANA